jgi:uncharacterized membrane protein YfbV (UPF0208 family)
VIVFGWIVLSLFAAYAAGVGVFTLCLLLIPGGLDAIVPALILALITACLTVAGMLWFSPISIAVSVS